MPGQKSNARQISSLGETPAEARARMKSSGGGTEAPPPLGEEVKVLTPQHIAAIRAEEEGFSGAGQDGSVEDAPELIEPPTPSKAMNMIRQLGQDKMQLLIERDSALNLVARYKFAFGELD